MFTPYSLVPATNSGNSYVERVMGIAPKQEKQMSWGNPPAQTKIAKPERTATNVAYIPEASKAMGLTLSEADIVDRLENYYAPKALGYAMPGTPDKKALGNFANQIATASSGYQSTADQFGTLYSDFVEGRLSEEETVDALRQMQQLSKSATGQLGTINKLFDNPMFGSPQMVAGVPMQRNTLGLTPAQRFTLPKETWNMNPAQLANWIQKYEKEMGNDWIGGKLAWTVGPSLIAGAAAGAITGLPGINLTNSIVGSGIEQVTGMNNRG